MKKNIIFLTFDDENSPYFDSLFKPILLGIQGDSDSILVIHLVTVRKSKISKMAQRTLINQNFTISRYTLNHNFKFLRLILTIPHVVQEIRNFSKNFQNTTIIFRSTIPTLFYIASRFSKVNFAKVIYDSDGLASDEKAEFGNWKPNNLQYLVGRFLEYTAINSSDTILVRSDSTISILQARGFHGKKTSYLRLVNGRDSEVFNITTDMVRSTKRASLGIEIGTPIIVYSGSLGPQYQLDLMLRIFASILEKKPKSVFLILTFNDNSKDDILISDFLVRHPNSILVKKIATNDLASFLEIADLGLSLRQESFSMSHVAPLKIREYLMCGLPIVTTVYTGDDSNLSSDFARYFSGDEAEIEILSRWLLDDVLPSRELIRVLARDYAVKNFSIDLDVQNLLSEF